MSIYIPLRKCPRMIAGKLKKPCLKCWARGLVGDRDDNKAKCIAYPWLQKNIKTAKKRRPNTNVFQYEFICVLKGRLED